MFKFDLNLVFIILTVSFSGSNCSILVSLKVLLHDIILSQEVSVLAPPLPGLKRFGNWEFGVHCTATFSGFVV